MQRIFAALALLVLFGGAGYLYFSGITIQDPEKIYEHAKELPNFDKAYSYIQDKVKHWKPDPEDPEIRIPKNWGKSQVTIGQETITVYSPDSAVPPNYYVSFEFPKKKVKSVSLIKCWGTAKEKTTDVCIVGDNPAIDAYFQILKLFKTPDFSGLAPTIE